MCKISFLSYWTAFNEEVLIQKLKIIFYLSVLFICSSAHLDFLKQILTLHSFAKLLNVETTSSAPFDSISLLIDC